MVKLFFRSLLAVVVFMSAWQTVGALAADCGNDVSTFIDSRDLANVLFILSGNQLQNEIQASDLTAIKKAIVSALNNAGIKPVITEKKEDIKADRFLKVHIYSVLLERQVYFCSVAVIQRQSSRQDGCAVVDYSDITPLAKKIPVLMQALMDSMLKNLY